MKLLFLLLCLFVGVELLPYTPIKQHPNCDRDPAYWCQSIATAKLCDKIQYCYEKVWSEPPKSADDKKQYPENASGTDFIKLLYGLEHIKPIESDEIAKISQFPEEKEHSLSDTSSTGMQNEEISCALCIEFFDNVKNTISQTSIADEIYDALSQLKSKNVCSHIGHCPKNFLLHQDNSNEIKESNLFKPGKESSDDLVNEKDVVNRSSPPPCILCKETLNELQREIKKDESKENIKSAMKRVCSEALRKSLKSKCKDLIREKGDEILNMLIKGLESQFVCSTIGLCDMYPLESVIENQKNFGNEVIVGFSILNVQIVQVPNLDDGISSIECSLCEQVMEKVQKEIIKEKSEDEIKNMLHKTCSLVYDEHFKKMCHKFIEENGDKIVDLLIQGVESKQICSMFEFCGENPHLIEGNNSDENMGISFDDDAYTDTDTTDDLSSNECALCKVVMKEAQKSIGKDKSKEHIKEVVEHACSVIHCQIARKKCNNFIEKNCDKIIDMLSKNVAPEVICSAIKLCKEHTIEKEQSPLNNDITCSICKDIVVFVRDQLENNKTEAEFKSLLKDFCKISKTYESKCLAWIETNFDEFYSFYISGVFADFLCRICSNEFCPNGESIDQWTHDVDAIIISASPHDCLECDRLLNKIVTKSGDDKSKENIKKVLEEICTNNGGKSFREEFSACKFLEKNEDKVIDMLSQNVASEVICSTIEVCKNRNEIERKPIPLNDDIDQWTNDADSNIISASPFECLKCEHLVKQIVADVGNDKSVEHIELVLQKSCSSIQDANLKKKCIDFVATHKDYIVNSLMNEIPPKQICHGLGFCAMRPIKMEIHQLSDQMMEKYSKAPECFVCQLIAVNLDEILKENSTINEIDYAIHNVCKMIPKEFFNDCEKSIENYAELCQCSTTKPFVFVFRLLPQ